MRSNDENTTWTRMVGASRDLMVCLLSLGVIAGCGGDTGDEQTEFDTPAGSTTAGATTESTEPEEVEEPEVMCTDGSWCGEVCADLERDARNCGECGVSCGSGEVCFNGRCSPTEADCTVDGCPTGQICEEGACRAGCATDEDCAAGTCDPDANACVCTPGRPGVLSANELLGSPVGAAVADFDGDGFADIVSTGYSENEVELLRGTSDGTFLKGESLGAGASPEDVVNLDIGGDGTQDIALVDREEEVPYQPYVWLLRNEGAGTFAPAVRLPSQVPVDSVAVGDIDGDGLDDIVGVSAPERAITVFLQQPGSTFEPTTWFVEGEPRDLIVTDLDRDGRTDLVVSEDNEVGGRVVVYWGRSDGFEDGPTFDFDVHPRIAVGRFDSDYLLDIVAADNSGVHLLEGAGNRQFESSRRISELAHVTTMTAGDLNVDGVDELVVGSSWTRTSYNSPSEDSLHLLRNTGEPQFAAERLFAGINAAHLFVEDLTSDGFPEVVSADWDSKTLSVLQADRRGGLVSATAVQQGSAEPIEHARLADVDGDGLDDIVAVSWDGFSVFGSTRDFAEELHAVDHGGPFEIVDFDGDGVLDVVFAGGRTAAAWMAGTPDGSFGPAQPLDIPTDFDGFNALVVADVDGDGNPDVVTGGDPFDDRAIYVALGDGAGGVDSTVRIVGDARSTHGFVSGDFDGDGIAEFANVHGVHGIAVYDFDGQAGFEERLLSFDELEFVEGLGAMDMDADGVHELVVSLSNYHLGHDIVVVDAAQLSITSRIPVDEAPHEFVVADSDGDGLDDLFANWEGRVYRFAGTSAAVVGKAEIFATAGEHLLFGNLDGDAMPDAVFYRSHSASTWLGIAQGTSCR